MTQTAELLGRPDLDDYIGLEEQAAKVELSPEDKAKVPGLVEKILQFIEAFSGQSLYDYQQNVARRVIESVVSFEGEEITVLMARQSGKTETLADTICGLMLILPRLALVPYYSNMLGEFKNGVLVGVFGPVKDQAETMHERIAERFRGEAAQAIMKDPEIAEVVKPRGDTIVLQRCGSIVRKMSAHAKAKIESKTYHLIVIDEAQDADERVIEKCVAEGTPIWLPDGRIVPVEDVVAQQLPVLALDREWKVPEKGASSWEARGHNYAIGSLVSTVPSEWHINGEQDVLEVRLGSGRCIKATPGHRWVCRSRRGNRRPRWVTTAELEPGMAVPQPRGVGAWGNDGTEEDGYFAGAMLGDGCLSGSSPMWCGFEDASRSQMRAWAEAHGCVERVRHTQPSGLVEVAYTTPGNGTNPVTAWLRQEGLWGLKGTEKKLARMDYSSEFCAGFLAGLLDTDGCATAGQVSFSGISEVLLRQTQDLLTRFGIYSSINVRSNSGSYGASPQPLWTVLVKGAEDVARFAAVVRSRNKDRQLQAVLEKHAQRRWSHRSAEDPRRGYDSTVCWDRVVSVKPAGRALTYCVTVEPSHLWVVNGTITGQSVVPMGAHTGATMILTGTPSYTKGYFYKALKRNGDEEVYGGKKSSFVYDWHYAAKARPLYAKHVLREMKIHGQDSDFFRMSYGCEWLLDKGMFISKEKLFRLSEPQMEIVQSYRSEPVLVGIDIAKQVDSTVVTVVKPDWDMPNENGFSTHWVLNWLEVQGEFEAQYAQIKQFLSPYWVHAIGLEDNGMGAGWPERLQMMFPEAHVEALGTSHKAQHVRFTHLTQLIQGYGPRGPLLRWPKGPETSRLVTTRRFAHQMLNAEKEWTPQGYLIVHSPKGSVNQHDDYVDSLALACVLSRELENKSSDVIVTENFLFSKR